MPAAYMLVRIHPETGAALAEPLALGTQLEKTFASRDEYRELLGTLRAEAQRLAALAVALSGEAEAEIEDSGRASSRRVFFLRLEDREGVHHLHAEIRGDAYDGCTLGELVATNGASDDVDQPLLPRA